MTRALITGIAGQDGSYLTELLLAKGYDVYGLIEPGAPREVPFVAPSERLHLLEGDLRDLDSIVAALDESRPDELYNLAAISFVGDSWEQAEAITDVNAVGVLRLLEAIRRAGLDVRFCQASSGQMLDTAEAPQRETTCIRPQSPYAAAKAYAYFISVNHRESYGMYVANAILFNHESPRRPPHFVTRKITRAAAQIKLGLAEELRLGNLDAVRDWGFAGDYVEAMWLMLQQERPGDFVLASGEAHTVRDFCAAAFGHLGLDWERYVVVDEQLLRPSEAGVMIGDMSLAREVLGWSPHVAFPQLVQMMVDEDIRILQDEVDAHSERL